MCEVNKYLGVKVKYYTVAEALRFFRNATLIIFHNTPCMQIRTAMQLDKHAPAGGKLSLTNLSLTWSRKGFQANNQTGPQRWDS